MKFFKDWLETREKIYDHLPGSIRRIGLPRWKNLNFIALHRKLKKLAYCGKLCLLTLFTDNSDAYLILATLIGSVIIYGAKNMPYIDALFFAAGSATQSGLNTYGA